MQGRSFPGDKHSLAAHEATEEHVIAGLLWVPGEHLSAMSELAVCRER